MSLKEYYYFLKGHLTKSCDSDESLSKKLNFSIHPLFLMKDLEALIIKDQIIIKAITTTYTYRSPPFL